MMIDYKCTFLMKTFTILVLLPAGFCVYNSPLGFDTELLTQLKNSLGECQACKIYIHSFKKGLELTSGANYEGGDPDSIEKTLKTPYKNSELRLAIIQGSICQEFVKHSAQCHQMADKAKEYIAQWWALHVESNVDPYEFVCIDKIKVCCPIHHYGKDCTPCPGDHEKLCSGNGKCRGDGTRKGNGTCLCELSYTGDNCDQCLQGYFVAYKDDNKLVCSKCHPSCMGGCRHGTPKDCVACKPGYEYDKDDGCMDINECEDNRRCKKNQFCLNSLGSYSCMECDKSCESCYGDGPDLCRKCAKGYWKEGELCITNKKERDPMEPTYLRYGVYIGLLVASGLIFPASTTIGSFIGMTVLSYIIGAEYYCMINGHAGLLDLMDFNLMQIFHT